MTPPANPAILIVHMDSPTRMAYRNIIDELGYSRVFATDSGNSAWAAINADPVDLIVSDWNLTPEITGLGLLKLVRTDPQLHQTPFLLMTERVTKNQVLEASQSGVTGVIIVPFTSEILKQKIDEALRGEDDPKLIQSKNLLDQGVQLFKQGKYEDAVISFKQILSVNENAEVYYNIGYIRTAQKQYDDAIRAFRKAIEINSFYAQAYQKLGEVYTKMGQEDKAQDFLAKAGEIFLERDQNEKAEKAFMKVLENNPNTPNVFNSLGIAYRRQNKIEESIKMYKKALKVNPFDENIHYNLARSYVNAKNYPAASKVLQSALKLNADFIEARNLLMAITRNVDKPVDF